MELQWLKQSLDTRKLNSAFPGSWRGCSGFAVLGKRRLHTPSRTAAPCSSAKIRDWEKQRRPCR